MCNQGDGESNTASLQEAEFLRALTDVRFLPRILPRSPKRGIEMCRRESSRVERQNILTETVVRWCQWLDTSGR